MCKKRRVVPDSIKWTDCFIDLHFKSSRRVYLISQGNLIIALIDLLFWAVRSSTGKIKLRAAPYPAALTGSRFRSLVSLAINIPKTIELKFLPSSLLD